MSMIEIKSKIHPFVVPTEVIHVMPSRQRQDGFSNAPRTHLSDLTPEALDALCNQFRTDAFAIAGMEDTFK